MNVTALTTHLIPDSQGRSGDDPIFALNAEATRRAKAGESIVNATLGALMEDDGRLATMPVVFETLAAGGGGPPAGRPPPPPPGRRPPPPGAPTTARVPIQIVP